MRRSLWCLSLAFGMVVSGTAWGQIPLRAYCMSVKFNAASVEVFGGLVYTLELNRDQQDPANGELVQLSPEAPYSHGGYLRLDDPSMGPGFFPFMLDLPPYVDRDNNQVDDFLEVDQAVTTVQTDGVFDDFLTGEAPIKATWSRPAHSRVGTCKLQLTVLNSQLVFEHQFEIFEYRGTWAPAAQGTNVTGPAVLKHQPANDWLLSGRLNVGRPGNGVLEILPTTWTNSVDATADVDVGGPFYRDGQTYQAYMGLTDGSIATGMPGYFDWILVVDDPRDSDQDGIPDLSDDTPNPVQPPRLLIAREGNQVILTAEGQVGASYELQFAGALPAGNWQGMATYVLTTARQELSRVPTTQGALYFRLLAK